MAAPRHLNVGDTEDLAANKAVSQEFFKLGDDEKDLQGPRTHLTKERPAADSPAPKTP